MRIRFALVAVLLLALFGCGGGGGGGASTNGGGSSDTTAPVTTAAPAGGTYATGQTVTLTANETATIYYTLDGTTPTTSSTRYAAPISINSSRTLKYFAVDAAGNAESVKSQVYTIQTNYFPLTPGITWTYKDSSNTTISRETTNDGRIKTVAGANVPKYSTYTITASNDIALTLETVTTSTTTISSFYAPGSIVIPSDLTPGYQENSNYTLTVGQGTPSDKTGIVTVVGFENVTVPAGTYSALRIDYTAIVNGVPSTPASSWYVNGIGLIKDSTMELVSKQGL
jgi:hypothetical protein